MNNVPGWDQPQMHKDSEVPATNVDWNVFAKAYAKDYDTSPFYFTQTSPKGAVRIACWSCLPTYTWRVAEHFISNFPEDVAVLLKSASADEMHSGGWARFHNASKKKDLVLQCAKDFEDYLLGDGTNELAVRRTDTGEYFALDSGGVLWLYPADDGKLWCDYLESQGFQLEYRTLITDVFHWTRKVANASEILDEIILGLGLLPV